MGSKQWQWGLGTMVAACLIVAGCAQPPVEEKSQAENARAAAQSAGAEDYASAEMQGANDLLSQAEGNMNQKNYSAAKQGYMDAKNAFDKAVSMVAQGKEMMAKEVATLKTEIMGRWEALEKTAKKMAKKMKADQKKMWSDEAKQAKELLGGVEQAIANSPAEAKRKLEQVKAMAEKWAEALK